MFEKLSVFKEEHHIKIGRDALFDLLSENKMLIKNRKRRVNTTQSFHWLKKYPNLIKDFTPVKPNQLWVSDITYWLLVDFLGAFQIVAKTILAFLCKKAVFLFNACTSCYFDVHLYHHKYSKL
ncbi:hypothetical protein FACS1894195_5340 [Bacteroidia bacterium]|nr:hypothetical protein FACS1894195_5340 [Bacteroidia bacterium]